MRNRALYFEVSEKGLKEYTECYVTSFIPYEVSKKGLKGLVTKRQSWYLGIGEVSKKGLKASESHLGI